MRSLHAQYIRVHDLLMIRQENTHSLFCTGMGISVFSSTNKKNWQRLSRCFDAPSASSARFQRIYFLCLVYPFMAGRDRTML